MSGLRAEKEVSPELQRIAFKAKQDKRVRFTSLAHLLTPDFLKASFQKLNRHGAPGPDGVTMETFRETLDVEIDDVWRELRAGQYRASPIRRVYIPKANGKVRPLGVPTVRDRTVQRAVGEILSTVYEPYFKDFSYGFRPGRSTHDALESLRVTIDRAPVRWVVEADIASYFDTVNHHWLMKFLQHRIADRTLLRLVAKWIKAGVMEGGVVRRSEEGTPQGGPLSPLLANIYLHYVLDLWFDHRFRPTTVGACALVRYADDFVVCFEHKHEAERFREDLEARFAEFGLRLSAEKTRLIEFGTESTQNGQTGPSETPRSFDFLGFTHYMRRKGKREGCHRVARKPSRKSRNKFLDGVADWLGRNRHLSVWFQAKVLQRKLRGYFAYFGLRYCLPALRHIKWPVERLWIMELRKRSQRHHLWWRSVLRQPWFHSLPAPALRR
ncbi:MAG: group II intron reverse transcriptase/maturase [Rhodospirillum sp.]|nr:group II intron reverse transcriptase/maturase [Rhodospirillum sp.]MCF8489604.1 group II intron reverse transcriptase/maturase [Rhodospirillum sp.]MCF8499635.1 group II intron reverse transcriptase/maturase [Rhodospirillum sp.]